MAKLSVINRDLKRRVTVKKFAERRKQLFAIINDQKATDDARDEARAKIQAMPRDASPVRLRNRCAMTGRPRGTFRKFGNRIFGRTIILLQIKEIFNSKFCKFYSFFFNAF